MLRERRDNELMKEPQNDNRLQDLEQLRLELILEVKQLEKELDEKIFELEEVELDISRIEND